MQSRVFSYLKLSPRGRAATEYLNWGKPRVGQLYLSLTVWSGVRGVDGLLAPSIWQHLTRMQPLPLFNLERL
jgi:hypothetical protein